MDKETLDMILNGIGTYVAILGSNKFSYTNAPANFDLCSNEVEYKGRDYLKNINSLKKDGVEYTIISYSDVTELKQKINIDSKTGALSNVGFNEKIHKIIDCGNPFILGMFDVDNFKMFNDIYGHDIGDAVLKAVVQMFKFNVKSSDIIGRFGGDEFLIAMSNIDIELAKQRISSIMSNLSSGLRFNKEKVIPITISCGISNYDYEISYEDNLKKVDDNLYIGKNNGKNQIISKSKGKTL